MLPAHRWFWFLILAAAAGAGLIYNFVFAAGASPLAGFVYGLSTGTAVLAFDRGLILAGVQARSSGCRPGPMCRPPNSPTC